MRLGCRIACDPVWADWSSRQLENAANAGPLYISDVVYAEISIRYGRIEDLDAMLATARIDLLRTAALFLAGKVFRQYRSAGGSRSGVLPDFVIGAHAAVAGLALITRDVGRHRTCFPSLALVMPD